MEFLQIGDGRIGVRCPFGLNPIMRSIRGAEWQNELKAWMVPCDEATAGAIIDGLGDVAVKKAKNAALVTDLAPKARGVVREFPSELPNLPDINKEAWRHQREAFHVARNAPSCKAHNGSYLAMDMGTGKSLTTIGLINQAINDATGGFKALISCPKSVIDVWPHEFTKHSERDDYIIHPMNGSGTIKKKTERAYTAAVKAKSSGRPLILVGNYDMIWRPPFGDWARKMAWDMVIGDEGHKLKSPTGRASRYFKDLGKLVRMRLLLSGTPMPHSPLDLFAQLRFLAPKILGWSYTAFKNEYAVMSQFNQHQVIGYRNQQKLAMLFGAIAYYVNKRDCLDLPPVEDVTVNVQLEPKTAKQYRLLERDMHLQLERGEVTAANALVKLLRLQQLAAGFLKTDDDRIVEIGGEKESALLEIIDSIPSYEPFVTFCRFHTDLDAVARCSEKLGRTCGELSGRRNDLAAWQRGEFDDLAVQIQAGGVGIDLTRACYGAYYTLGYSLGEYEQSRARLDRPGQTRPVTYYHLIAAGTVDERVYSALSSREEVIGYVINQMRHA